MKEHWIVPCNPKQLDIKKHVLKTDLIAFKKVRPLTTGDDVYIYICGKQDQQIKYKGVVVDDNCNEEEMKNHLYAVSVNEYGKSPYKYVLIKLSAEFPDGTVTIENLKDCGFGQVQCQARTSRILLEFLKEKENLLTKLNHY